MRRWTRLCFVLGIAWCVLPGVFAYSVAIDHAATPQAPLLIFGLLGVAPALIIWALGAGIIWAARAR